MPAARAGETMREDAPALSPDATVAADTVLAAHPLDAYARLMLPYAYAYGRRQCGAAKAQFARLALLLHPDRCTHPRAGDAFAAVTAAWRTLSDCSAVDELDAAVSTAADELQGWRRLEVAAEGQPATARSSHTCGADGRLCSIDGLAQEALQERVAAVLTASESRQERFLEQVGEDGGSGGTGRRAGKRRGRKAAARRRSNFVKPADPSIPTRHLHVANTGSSIDMTTESPSKPAAALDVAVLNGMAGLIVRL